MLCKVGVFKFAVTSLRHNAGLFALLVVAWFFVVFYGDIAVFSSAAIKCGRTLGIASPPPSLDVASRLDHASRILFISDPQLTNTYSYAYMKNGLLNYFVAFYSDLFMRKSYIAIQRFLRPEVVFFTGDLFDGVTKILFKQDNRTSFTPAEYLALMIRWNWIFGRYSSDPGSKWLFNVSGNHDIGWQISDSDQHVLVRTYEQHFGALNYITRIGNFSFIVLASGIYIPPTSQSLSQRAEQFLTTLSQANDSTLRNRALIFHVPLWRAHDSDCGPRSRLGPINAGRGYSYTNLAPESITNRLLTELKPRYIFSGDTHDHCEVIHEISNTLSAVERTLNTFSWCQGSRVPSFGFATLNNMNMTLKFEYCDLPDQVSIYLTYALLACGSIVATCFVATPSQFRGAVGIETLKERKPWAARTNSTKVSANLVRRAIAKSPTVSIILVTTFIIVIGWHLLLVWIYL